MQSPHCTRRTRVRLRPYLLLASALLACNSVAPTDNATSTADRWRTRGTPATVSVIPGTVADTVGQSTAFAAVARDSHGDIILTATINWQSANPGVMTIDATGHALAMGAGTTTITATSGGVTGSAAVVVSANTVPVDAVKSITLTPGSASPTVGQAVQFVATLLDSVKQVVSGRHITWASSAPNIVQVDTNGQATALTAGTATVSASSDGVTGTAPVQVANVVVVSNPGAIADLAGVPVNDSSITLSFTAVNDGTGQPAKYELRSGLHPMSWGSASPVTIGSCASPISGYAIGATVSCTVTHLSPATMYDFQVVAFRGTLNVDAVFGSLSNVATVTTPSAPAPAPAPPPPAPSVASVVVTPTSVTDTVGQKTQFAAVAKDASGNTLSGQTFTWSSSNTSVLTVSSTGLMTGVAAGSANVVATASGVSGHASVTVNAPPAPAPPPPSPVVTTVSVSPSSASIVAGSTQQLSATIKDQNGNVMTGLTVSWSSSASSVATVNGSGLVTAVAAGTATITASNGGKIGTAAITVTSPPSSPPPSNSAEPTPSGTTIWQDNFQNYNTSADILNAYTHLNNESRLFVDATGGLNGTKGMRIDWPAQVAGSCTDDDHLIEKGFSATKEIYVQYYVRYQAGFVFDWRGFSPCVGNAKKLFLVPGGAGSRADLISENHHIVLYEDNIGYNSGLQNVGTEFTPEMLGDGNWHRITIHARQSSSAGANDGVLEGWIDGVKLWSKPNSVSTAGYQYFQMPTVFNSGSPVAQSEWVGKIVVWKP